MTGHTGFKGSWLSFLLAQAEANVSGYALAPNTEPNLFSLLGLANKMSHTVADIRDAQLLKETIQRTQPEVVFHLAAQPLVRKSYELPLETYSTNVLGTANLLEACRGAPSIRAIVVITTDKVYENLETNHSYCETDRLGGFDPYSSSKACTEILTSSYRKSFFAYPNAPLIATVRAGNVIGGGDWSEDRLIPDMIRAIASGQTFQLRNPQAVRPWQHVLEPLFAYSRLAEQLASGNQDCACALNIGPWDSECLTVEQVCKLFEQQWPGGFHRQVLELKNAPHEAQLLRLDCTLATRLLQWKPRWTAQEAIGLTAKWYRAWLDGENMEALTKQQIHICRQS